MASRLPEYSTLERNALKACTDGKIADVSKNRIRRSGLTKRRFTRYSRITLGGDKKNGKHTKATSDVHITTCKRYFLDIDISLL